MLYLWLKAFHLIFMVCWFACLFYLPRLFVNVAVAVDDNSRQQLIGMQQKLLRFSIPFVFLTIGLGAWLVLLNPGYYLSQAWFHAKIFLVLLLVIYHFACGRMVRGFMQGEPHRSARFYRWFNELPVFILFGVIILIVVKPF